VIRPASKLTDPMRLALREAKPGLLTLLNGSANPVELSVRNLALDDDTVRLVHRLTSTDTGLIASPGATDKADSSQRSALIEAINRCCDARGDDVTNRAGLIAECTSLAPDGQADMREHFEAEAKRCERPLRLVTRTLA
jgi:hypothetical protein